MSHVINDDCFYCDACRPECPVDCIYPGDDIYEIDEDVCIDCGACITFCPADAIYEA